MAKFCGKIGFSAMTEVRPGVWDDEIAEREYRGEVIRNLTRFESSGQANDDLTISNEISVIADPFAKENYQDMRYVEYLGAKWKIKSIEVRYPRLELILGGEWNG